MASFDTLKQCITKKKTTTHNDIYRMISLIVQPYSNNLRISHEGNFNNVLIIQPRSPMPVQLQTHKLWFNHTITEKQSIFMYQTYNSSRPLSSHRTPMVIPHYTTYTIVIKLWLQYKELSLIRQFLLSLKKQPDSLNTV